MLCQFSFKNYKSFRNEAFLDFYAEKISDHEANIIVDTDGEKVLPVISIYGPNGGGKSNVLEALGYVRHRVLSPLLALNLSGILSENDENLLYKSIKNPAEDKYYKFCKSPEKQPMQFELRFRHKFTDYIYEISFVEDNVSLENLYYKKVGEEDIHVVFERTKNGLFLNEEFGNINASNVNPVIPLLSYLSINFHLEEVGNVMDWFTVIHILDFNNPILENNLMLPKNEKDTKRFYAMLKEMDIDIDGIRVEKDLDGNFFEAYCMHTVNGKSYEIPIQEESSGTKKVLSCLARIHYCIKKGFLVVADELDAKLHPQLLKYIISLFKNMEYNKNGAQLLLTSHDLFTMSSKVFRRDEIWFCAMNRESSSFLYSLFSLKDASGNPPRKDAIFYKQYLEGKYGADPYIRKAMKWEDDYES